MVQATVLNLSESGLAIATPYKPVLNSIVHMRIDLPGNDTPYETRAQVIRWSFSGQIGLKLLKPESFQTHFDNWRKFSTQQVSSNCYTNEVPSDPSVAAVVPEADGVLNNSCIYQSTDVVDPGEAIVSSSSAAVGTERIDMGLDEPLDMDALRAILQEDEATDRPLLSRTGLVALGVGCVLLAASVWAWYGRTHRAVVEAHVAAAQTSDTPTTESPSSTNSAAATPAQSTAELAGPSHLDTAKGGSLPNVPQTRAPESPVSSRQVQHQGDSRAQLVVTLNRFTRVNAKRLHNPDRIYFDLSPGIHPKISKGLESRAGNHLVRRIRIGRAKDGHTRVVLDLLRPCEYHASVSSAPPYRLTINIRAGRGKGNS
jgi:hypothetical protein